MVLDWLEYLIVTPLLARVVPVVPPGLCRVGQENRTAKLLNARTNSTLKGSGRDGGYNCSRNNRSITVISDQREYDAKKYVARVSFIYYYCYALPYYYYIVLMYNK